MLKNLHGITTALIATAVLSACGGGSSGTASNNNGGAGGGGGVATVTLTGVAAAGQPISGVVSARDSLGKPYGPATINTNGVYSLNVTGGISPFVVQASGVVAGNAGTYYSAVNAASGVTNIVANITPFTNMVVAQAANQDPAIIFNSCTSSGTCTLPNAAALTTALANVQGSLSNLLTQFSVAPGTNLLTTPFVAGAVTGQSPIDVLFDAIVVTPVSGVPTSFNVTANPTALTLPASTVLLTLPPTATATSAPIAVNTLLTASAVASTTTVATAMASVKTGLTAFQNLFATANPLPTAVTSLLDATFMQNGANAAAFASSVVGINGFPIGGTFSAPVAINPLDGGVANDATHQWFQSTVIPGGQANRVSMLMIKQASGSWLLAGNQRQIGINVSPFAQQIVPNAAQAASGVPTAYSTGMNFGLGLMASNGNPDPALTALGVTNATVSGPGVIGATSGVLGAATIFSSTAAIPGTQNLQPCSVAVAANCVNVAQVVPGSYIFTITGTTFSYVYTHTHKEILPALATLTAANFPTITAVPALSAILPNANVSVSWTVPTGQLASGVGIYVSGALGNTLVSAWKNIKAATALPQTSSVVLPNFVGAVSSANINPQSVDPVTGVYYMTNQQF